MQKQQKTDTKQQKKETKPTSQANQKPDPKTQHQDTQQKDTHPKTQTHKTNPPQKKTEAHQDKFHPIEQKPAAKKQEDAKTAPAVAKVDYVKTIPLVKLVEEFEAARDLRKGVFIVDPSNNAFNFFKYKGNVIDISEYAIKGAIEHKQLDEYREACRKKMVIGLHYGHMTVIYIDKMLDLYNRFFDGASFYQPEQWFDLDKMFDEKYHKKHILTPEEDKDHEGNKGMFIAKKDFCLCILTSSDLPLSEILETIKVPNQLLHFIKIQ